MHATGPAILCRARTLSPRSNESGVTFSFVFSVRGLSPELQTTIPPVLRPIHRQARSSGFGLLWTVFFTTPFMIAIQLVSAHIGRVTGKGIAANAKQFYPLPIVLVPVCLL